MLSSLQIIFLPNYNPIKLSLSAAKLQLFRQYVCVVYNVQLTKATIANGEQESKRLQEELLLKR